MLTKERSLTPETWNVTRGMASEDKLHHLSPRWRSKWNLCRGGVLLAPWLILLANALHLTVFRQSMHPSVTRDGISLSSYTRSFTSPDWSLLLAECNLWWRWFIWINRVKKCQFYPSLHSYLASLRVTQIIKPCLLGACIKTRSR